MLSKSSLKQHYTENLVSYQRLITREVNLGGLILGGGSRVKVQSMTTSDTMETKATVDQIKSLVDVGCEIVRVTTPSRKSSENLAEIKNRLIQQNYRVPLVADVHFNPQAALKAAEVVEKVRINPGNFVDRKRFQVIHYTDKAYRSELKRVEDKLIPLIEVCKKNGTALRIGTNHGSLSDRIINRFGDNPEGMVHSALEFLDICEREHFDQIVFSMKSSNTSVMVIAYRLLVKMLKERGRIYPLHLGVTEAGDGENGRIKSAVGIGSLLSDGIGDTIRVSLTEDSTKEIPVAKKIVDYFQSLDYQKDYSVTQHSHHHPYEFRRSKSRTLSNLGGGSVPKIILEKSALKTVADVEDIGFNIIPETEKWVATDLAADLVSLSHSSPLSAQLPYIGVKTLFPIGHPTLSTEIQTYPLIDIRDLKEVLSDSQHLMNSDYYFLTIRLSEIKLLSSITDQAVLIIETESHHPAMEARELILKLKETGIDQPIFLKFNPPDQTEKSDLETRQIHLAAMAGVLLIDGLLDGLFLGQKTPHDLSILFSILQASRQRISRTEYISCPSCGRTLFDLQKVTAKIKAATNHLKEVKIAIMGCVVNGPGEMADADFGYVGSGPGKITLYKGKEAKIKNVPSEQAVEALIDLLKTEGAWQDR